MPLRICISNQLKGEAFLTVGEPAIALFMQVVLLYKDMRRQDIVGGTKPLYVDPS